MRIAQPIIVVGGILVVDAGLELEATGGHVGNDPLAVPDGIGASTDGRGAEAQVRVLLLAGGQAGVQLGIDVGIGGHGVDVGYGQVVGTVEGEFERVAWGR